MAAEIDRQTYCERVGIDPSTLSRWVNDEVLDPERRKPYMQQFFTEEDVRFGRALIALIRRYRGQYTLAQLVEVVRGERELSQFPRSPRTP